MKKLFTILTLLLCICSGAWAATEDLAAATSDKTAYSGTSFTTSANMMTNNTSNNYIKVRTNMDTPQWTFNVNTGYKITGIKVVGYSNNSYSGATITMSTMRIDGGENILTASDATEFPADKNNPITLNKSGFEATSSITCTFDNSKIITDNQDANYNNGKNSQLMVKITITYEATGTPVTLTFSPTTASNNIGEDFTAPTLTVSPVAATSEVAYSSSNTNVATVNASTGAVTILGAGTTTITAAISGSATYINTSASYTLTVTDPTAKSVTYSPASNTVFAAGASDNITNSGETVATITYSESGDGYKSFTFNKGGATYDGIAFNALTEGNGTNGNSAGGTFYTIVPKYDGIIKIAVAINKDKTMIVEEDGKGMSGFTQKTEKFYGFETIDVKAGKSYKCYVSGSKMGFYGLVYSYSTVAVSTLTDRNYASYVPSRKLDFSSADGITAYIATGLNAGGTAVELQEVDVVAAGTPIIVKTDTKGATVNVPVTTASASDTSSNLLVAGDGTTAATNEYYFLKEDQFHQANSGTLQSGKAYLHITSGAPVLSFDFGNTTGIEQTRWAAEHATDAIYTLGGQRVSDAKKGLYIKNGRKIIVK